MSVGSGRVATKLNVTQGLNDGESPNGTWEALNQSQSVTHVTWVVRTNQKSGIPLARGNLGVSGAVNLSSTTHTRLTTQSELIEYNDSNNSCPSKEGEEQRNQTLGL